LRGSSRAGVSCLRAETPASVETSSQQIRAPRVGRCSDSSDSAANGRAKRCARTAPLPRSRSLPLLLVVVRSGRLASLGEDDRFRHEAALQAQIGSADLAGLGHQATTSCEPHRWRAMRSSLAAPKLCPCSTSGGCGYCARSPSTARSPPPPRRWTSRRRRAPSRSPRSGAILRSRLPEARLA
jgi:hypothetical protein